MATQRIGIVRGLAWRDHDGAPMQEVNHQILVASCGLAVEAGRARRRGVTILSLEAWREACRELGCDLPWHTRRANVLVEGLDLAETLGRDVRIDSTLLRIHGETKPCGLMDRSFDGLKAALEPRLRGGVHAEVLVGGSIRVGDLATIRTCEPGPSCGSEAAPPFCSLE